MQGNQALYKKALFLSAKRALKENEIILRNFVQDAAIYYDDVKLQNYITLIDKYDDLTLYDMLTNCSAVKEISDELHEIVKDINKFINTSFKQQKYS